MIKRRVIIDRKLINKRYAIELIREYAKKHKIMVHYTRNSRGYNSHNMKSERFMENHHITFRKIIHDFVNTDLDKIRYKGPEKSYFPDIKHGIVYAYLTYDTLDIGEPVTLYLKFTFFNRHYKLYITCDSIHESNPHKENDFKRIGG